MKSIIIAVITTLLPIHQCYHIINRSALVLTNFSNISFLPFQISPKNDYFHETFVNATGKIDKLLSNSEEESIDKANYYSGNPECQIYIPSLLNRINLLREKHDTVALNWSDTLAKGAREEAMKYEGTGCPVFRVPPVGGRIIKFELGALVNEVELVNSWYEGAYAWDYEEGIPSKPGVSPTPFLQMMWNSSVEVGCGKGCCLESDVWICDFSPGADLENNNGTIIKDNVLPPRDEYKEAFGLKASGSKGKDKKPPNSKRKGKA